MSARNQRNSRVAQEFLKWACVISSSNGISCACATCITLSDMQNFALCPTSRLFNSLSVSRGRIQLSSFHSYLLMWRQIFRESSLLGSLRLNGRSRQAWLAQEAIPIHGYAIRVTVPRVAAFRQTVFGVNLTNFRRARVLSSERYWRLKSGNQSLAHT